MPLLEWRPAERSDRSDLERFTCTQPARYDRQRRRPVHQRPWELDLQSEIRTLNPTTQGQSLYLGFDDEGLAALYLFADLGVDEYKLQAVAVALRHRRQGGVIAEETIKQALATIAHKAARQGHSTAYVFGFIDARNLPSRRMCSAQGFTPDDAIPGPDGLQQWSVVVACGDDPGPG